MDAAGGGESGAFSHPGRSGAQLLEQHLRDSQSDTSVCIGKCEKVERKKHGRAQLFDGHYISVFGLGICDGAEEVAGQILMQQSDLTFESIDQRVSAARDEKKGCVRAISLFEKDRS